MSHLSWLGSTRVHCSLFVHWLYWYYVIQQFAFFFLITCFSFRVQWWQWFFLNSNNSSFFRTQYHQLFLSGFFFSKVVGKPSIGQIPTSKIVWSQYYLRNVTSYIQPYLSYFFSSIFNCCVHTTVNSFICHSVLTCINTFHMNFFFFFLCYLLSSLSTLCPPVDGYRPYIWLSPCSC